MTTAIETDPVLNGTVDEFAMIGETLRRLQARFSAHQELVVAQQTEIERLKAKIEQLRDQLDKFYEHHGLVAKPLTAEQIKDMDENGLSGEEFMAEVTRVFGA